MSLAFLQLQLGTNICPLDLDYKKWSYLAPLSWTKMLWKTLHVTGFELHLAYDSIPFPRKGDKLVMDILMDRNKDKEQLMALARVRGFLNVIFLSDIVTADGRYFEQFAITQGPYKLRSKFIFPKEFPNERDSQLWINFWQTLALNNFTLSAPLGPWINPSHRTWEWYYNEEENIISCLKADSLYHHYSPSLMNPDKYSINGSSSLQQIGIPVLVKLDRKDQAILRSKTNLIQPSSQKLISFWDILGEWKGEWMWEFLDKDRRKEDYTWIEEGMKKGTLIWCADGSYNRKLAPRISGVGWIAHCVISGKSMEGLFYEETEEANAYCAEQLGICAIYHLIAAISLFYNIKNWKTRVGCDNYGTIKISRRRLKRIRPSIKCADILRNIRSSRNLMST